MKIMILNGPNLNLLGTREPGIYGKQTLEEINRNLRKHAEQLDVQLVETLQSNSESQLIDKIHSAQGVVDGLLFNPAAFTHTSVALRDALLATDIPFVEVHLSNPAAREPFRKQSFFSDIALGVVSGLGPESYLFALEGLVNMLRKKGENKVETK